MSSPVLLLILDGWGMAPAGPGNAVSLAHTPNLDALMGGCPWTTLRCSGPDVGLPRGQMGNSEVGHLNLGAGRIVCQDILRIDLAIEDGSLAENRTIHDLVSSVRKNGGRIHLMGLVSDGGVHSRQAHLHALLDIFQDQGVSQCLVHAFLDGRDTPPASGAGYLGSLREHMARRAYGRVASVSGRYYAMDRDKRWDRVAKAYRAMVLGEAPKFDDPVRAVQDSYDQGVTDEFVVPMAASDPGCGIRDGDAVLFFNFRADRARELTRAFIEPDFSGFERTVRPCLAAYVTMTEYEEDFCVPVVFEPVHMDGLLGEVVSQAGRRQLRVAETEKYAHVTYFFNGGEEEPFEGEDRILVPSPREVATYDLKPEMSVFQVASELISRLPSYDLVVCNFANLDMVGHTGSIPAVIKACEAVDQCVGQVMKALLDCKGQALVTADHGNAEEMFDQEGKPKTSHTTNPVAAVLVGQKVRASGLRTQGRLADVAPTLLHLMGLEKSSEMTGTSLMATEQDRG